MPPLRYDPSSPSPFPTGEDVIDPEVPPYRVWIPEKPLIVLGNSQTPEAELHLDAVRADRIPVYQRKGGGGAVHLDGGCVCVAIRFAKRKDWGIRDYFGAGNDFITQVLRDACGVEAVPRGISDLAVETLSGERKISGSSLYLPRENALFLVSILVDARIADWDRYLRHPGREPDYRGGRGHADFVANLAALPGGKGTTVAALRRALEASLP